VVEVVIAIGEMEGEGVKVKTISILEDYWHDYLHFKELKATGKGKSELRDRRYLRVAFLTLMAYGEGVVNQWRFSILREQGKSEDDIYKCIRRETFYSKCNKLTKKASLTPGRKRPVIQKARRLRNDFVHLTSGRDAMLFDDLTDTLIGEIEEALTGWLDEVSAALGMERHPNTKEIGRDIAKALGATKHEE
jgi:hypothetical protein